MNRAWRVSDLPAWIVPNVTKDRDTGCFRVSAGNTIWINSGGYAMVGGTAIHRLVYMELVGEIPAATPVLDHVKARGCRWTNCSLPSHLQPVTSRENTLRGVGPAALNARKDRCSTCGREYDLFNTYYYPDGRRDCRWCRAVAREQYVIRQRGSLAQAGLGQAA